MWSAYVYVPGLYESGLCWIWRFSKIGHSSGGCFVYHISCAVLVLFRLSMICLHSKNYNRYDLFVIGKPITQNFFNSFFFMLWYSIFCRQLLFILTFDEPIYDSLAPFIYVLCSMYTNIMYFKVINSKNNRNRCGNLIWLLFSIPNEHPVIIRLILIQPDHVVVFWFRIC